LFGNDGASGNEALHRLQEQFNADEKRQEQAAAHNVKKQRGKKSARPMAVEQQAVDASKMPKDIYRKLTSALHLGREADETKRARKTALLSEANKNLSCPKDRLRK
jgi:acetyl-CoA carboxylase carboxyltransferase component